jgi:hypothetical protein
MSEKKTIQINPDLFRFTTTNKTRKKRDESNKPIKIKTSTKPVSSKTVRNRLLKYIRQQQDTNYKQQFSSTPNQIIPKPASTATSSNDSGFESDFEDSLKYLSSIAEKNQNAISPEYKRRHNATLRQLPPTTESLLYGSTLDNTLFDTNVGLELPDVFNDVAPSSTTERPMLLQRALHPAIPKYGCLKNGALPTYRMWKNQTLRAPPISTHVPTSMGGTNIAPNPSLMKPSYPGITVVGGTRDATFGRSDAIRSEATPNNMFGSGSGFGSGSSREAELLEMKKQYERKKTMDQRPRPKNLFRKLKQKRTLRRTYRVGKSKHYPRVGVLVSNKTLRKQITTKAQLLKQVPMEEVKKTLIKKGLIKVGSTAPTDVLRKMYESVSLVCGDIQNHNPDNLLYNYMNGGDA